jgi:hypothetical protein
MNTCTHKKSEIEDCECEPRRSERMREAVAETERQWQGDPSPLRRALYAHFERYNLTAPRTGPQRDDF